MLDKMLYWKLNTENMNTTKTTNVFRKGVYILFY
jgi:hypothetical protein